MDRKVLRMEMFLKICMSEKYSAVLFSSAEIDHGEDFFDQVCLIQEAQLMPTNPRDAFRGQSRSTNMVLFDMLGMVS